MERLRSSRKFTQPIVRTMMLTALGCNLAWGLADAVMYVVRTVTDNIQHIGHFHTGGVPGRHEIDDTQELNYRVVMRAIADAGFKGYVAQEFIPTRDPRQSLAEAVAICTV